MITGAIYDELAVHASSWIDRSKRFSVIEHRAATILDAIERRARMRSSTSVYLNQDERIVLHYLSTCFVHGTSRTPYARARVLEFVDLAREELIARITKKLTNH